MGFWNSLKWAVTAQSDYIAHWNPLVDWIVIDTETGEYINTDTGEREPPDRKSIQTVNNSFWTVKRIK